MALDIGDSGAGGGMTKAIYDQLNAVLMPKVPEADLPDAQKGWKELAFAIATGVVQHILANLEITGLQVSGTANLTVQNNSASGTVTLQQTGNTGHLVR
jgi:hypothetical protein